MQAFLMLYNSRIGQMAKDDSIEFGIFVRLNIAAGKPGKWSKLCSKKVKTYKKKKIVEKVLKSQQRSFTGTSQRTIKLKRKLAPKSWIQYFGEIWNIKADGAVGERYFQ